MFIYHFSLRLPYSECLGFYEGSIRYVIVTDDNGKRIRLGTHHLRPFITNQGIHGYFRMFVNQNSAIERIERVR